MTVDDAKALEDFSTETGLQVTDVDVLSTQGIGCPPHYHVSVQVILPSY